MPDARREDPAGTNADQHPLFARLWGFLGPRAMSRRDRARLLDGLSGEVLELGAGDGLNFAHYPASVGRVLALEPERALRAKAVKRAAETQGVRIEVQPGSSDPLPAADATFDAAVACLVLCTVPNQDRALTELHRVLRPGGELRFYEHVRASRAVPAAVQHALDRTGIWPTIGAGCHLGRDTGAAITRNGFTITEIRSFVSGPGSETIGLPHIAGRATRH